MRLTRNAPSRPFDSRLYVDSSARPTTVRSASLCLYLSLSLSLSLREESIFVRVRSGLDRARAARMDDSQADAGST